MKRYRIRRAAGLMAWAAALAVVSGAGARFALGGESIAAYGPNPKAFLPNYASRTTPLRHWRRFPVKVWFQGDARCGERDLHKVVTAGFDLWVGASQGAIRYTVTNDPKAADITVRFKKIERTPQAGTRVGTTEVKYIGSQATAATIDLMLWDGMSSHEIEQGLLTTAAHEFGHALGVIDHSGDPQDLMYRAHRCDIAVPISARDINTLKSHYAWLFAAPGDSPATASAASAVSAGATAQDDR